MAPVRGGSILSGWVPWRYRGCSCLSGAPVAGGCSYAEAGCYLIIERCAGGGRRPLVDPRQFGRSRFDHGVEEARSGIALIGDADIEVLAGELEYHRRPAASLLADAGRRHQEAALQFADRAVTAAAVTHQTAQRRGRQRPGSKRLGDLMRLGWQGEDPVVVRLATTRVERGQQTRRQQRRAPMDEPATPGEPRFWQQILPCPHQRLRASHATCEGHRVQTSDRLPQ